MKLEVPISELIRQFPACDRQHIRICLAILEWSGASCNRDCTLMLQKVWGMFNMLPGKG